MEKRDCSYEDMSNDKVWEDSEEKTYQEPYKNRFEESRYGSNGIDQSGMKGQ